MRKADYAALADILRYQIDLARRADQAGALAALQATARHFAERASVDRAAFLQACGITQEAQRR